MEIFTPDNINQKVLLHKYTKFETSMSINTKFLTFESTDDNDRKPIAI